MHPAAQGVERYYAAFNQKEWDRGSFTLLQVHDDLAVVKAVLTREAADRRLIKAWNCSYTMRRVEKNWLFTLITSDDTGDDQAGLGPAST